MKSFQAKNLTDRSIVGLLMIFLGFTVVLVSGCKQAQSEANNSEDEVEIYETPDPLTALVIGDVDLGARMKRQWSARRDGELTIVDSTVAEFIDGGMVVPANVDLIVYPPSLLGELVNREILAQTPRDVWSSEELNKREILKHNRNLVVRHANKNWAMPLGGHNFAMFCNRELFEKSELEPPETWSKLDRALTKLEPALEELGNEKLKPKVDMPLGDGWAAHTYMARAASAIAHRGKLTTVFDRKTMKPLINQSGFVEVLESLKSIASERSVDLTPAEVYQLAYSGQSSIAFTWPAKGFGGDADDENTIPRVAPMPGGERWYDSKNLRWGKRSASEQFKIDTVGFAGMIGSVCVQSSNDQTAWEFLTWLSSKSISLITLSESPTIGPFRASHLGDVGVWTGDCISIDVADEYAEVVVENHERSQALIFPRVANYHLYIEALDKAVQNCVSGKQTAQEAMDEAAAEWEKVTESVGRNKQVRNLKNSTGL